MKEELINQIIAEEWEMFQNTQNVGGRAWCQDDKVQFDANRRAQFEIWNENTLRLYLIDLEKAKNENQNLVTLKYAYMMETTAPEEYELLKDRIPEIDEEKREYIERMSEMTASWCEQFAVHYPNLASHSRPARPIPSAPRITSALTYCKGELSTYSLETLKSLNVIYEQYAAEQKNLFEKSVEKEIWFLLHKSLEEVEESMG